MTTFQDQEDDVIFSEPIKAKDECKVKIIFAELSKPWTVKQGVTGYEGQQYPVMKLTLQIIDTDVECEHEDAKPRLVIEDRFCLEKYPCMKEDKLQWIERQKLYDLESAFGFEPLYVVNEERVEPFITKNGNKVAPKIAGVKHKLNPDFAFTYFDNNGIPKVDNWVDKELLAKVEVEKSETYGDKNVIKRYKRLA